MSARGRGVRVTGADRYDRRTFLGRSATGAAAAALAGIGGPTLLGACSSSSSSSGTGAKPGVGTGTPHRGGSLTVGLNSEIDGSREFLSMIEHEIGRAHV